MPTGCLNGAGGEEGTAVNTGGKELNFAGKIHLVKPWSQSNPGETQSATEK